MAQEFHYFACLPYELRQMIWLECISSRVVELEVPPTRTLSSHSEACLKWTAHQNTRLPVVTRVNRESREITLKAIPRPLDTGWSYRSDNLTTTAFPWFNPKLDIVSLTSMESICQVWADFKTEDTYFMRHARRARGVVLPAQIIYPFRHLMLTMDYAKFVPTIRREEADRISSLKDIMVCMRVLEVHMSPSDALKSTISGRTGDGLVELVDAYDAAKIKKIFEEVKPTDPDAVQIFKLLLDTETLHLKLKEWEKNVVTNWVCQRYLNSWRRTPTQQEYEIEHDLPACEPECLINPPGVTNTEPMDWHQFEKWYLEYRPPEFGRFAFDMNDPWVQWAYDDVPKIRPMIMFRLCVGDCSVLESTKLRQDIYCHRYPQDYVESSLMKRYAKMRVSEKKEEDAWTKDSRLILKRF